jgi:hypothetical protein
VLRKRYAKFEKAIAFAAMKKQGADLGVDTLLIELKLKKLDQLKNRRSTKSKAGRGSPKRASKAPAAGRGASPTKLPKGATSPVAMA